MLQKLKIIYGFVIVPRQPLLFEKSLARWSSEYQQLTTNEKSQIAQYLNDNWSKMTQKMRVAEYALRLNINNDEIIKKTVQEFEKFRIAEKHIDHNQLLDLLILSLRVLNVKIQKNDAFYEKLGYLSLKLQSLLNNQNILEKYTQYCTIMKLYKKIRNDAKIQNLEQLFNIATASFHKNISFSRLNSRDTNIIITCLENLLQDQGTLEVDNELIKDIISQAVGHLIQTNGVKELDNLSLMSLTTAFSAEGQQKHLLFSKIIDHIGSKLPEEKSKERFLIGTLYHIFIKQKYEDISQLYELLNKIKNFTFNEWDYCAHLSLINRLGPKQSLELLTSQKDIILSYKAKSPQALQRIEKIRVYMSRKFNNIQSEVVNSVIAHLKSQQQNL